MKLLQHEKEKNPRVKLARFIKFGVVIFLAVFFLEIWMVNRLSTYGYKIQELKSVKDSLTLDNQVLENQIAQLSSLPAIEEKALQLGFAPVKNLDYYKPASLASVN